MNLSQKGRKIEAGRAVNGHVSWKSPSNIALVKYWGKHGIQLPQNPSISFTLSEAHTITSIDFESKKNNNQDIEIDFLFNGTPKKLFKEKIEKYLLKYIDIIPWLTQVQLKIESSNSFPHSSGIASSASSMSALAFCLCDIEAQLFETTIDIKRVSFLSRLLSGSASRSVYPTIGMWGQHDDIEGSSDLFAIPFWKEIDPVFLDFRNDILIVSSMEKPVSSRAGHKLMETNSYAAQRYKNAYKNLTKIVVAMKEGDLMAFGKIVEEEALQLHALMMCSDPSFILVEPDTLRLIKEIRSYRMDTQLPLFFTLDAGPNIHLLYPNNIAEEVRPFVKDFLQPLCLDGRIINDHVGEGPVNLLNV